jgi:hypothetical protein
MKKGYLIILILMIIIIPNQGITQNNISSKPANENELLASVETKDASGNEMNDAFIKLKISGGQGPYNIHCFSPYSLPSGSVGYELKVENIKPGKYLFVIQDKKGQSLVKEITIGPTK